jgi:RimJ/RimL family protein N-acetyltransferase
MADPVDPNIELFADGLRLRPYRVTDADALIGAVCESIDCLGQWLSWCPPNYGRKEAQAWIAHCANAWRRREEFAFAVFDAHGGEYLGGVGLNQPNRVHNFMNLGYWIRTSRQRSGLASRAARRLAEFGFAQLGLTRIEIVMPVTHVASERTAARVGATFEGVGRNRLLLHGRPVDASMYALVPPDAG